MKAQKRLEQLLDDKDERIEALEIELQELKDEEESNWEWARHKTLKKNLDNLPVPRLESMAAERAHPTPARGKRMQAQDRVQEAMNIICQLKDHRWDENASAYGAEYCTRCQREFPHYPDRVPPGAATLRGLINLRLWFFRQWVSSLGQQIRNRFRKTDNDIPF